MENCQETKTSVAGCLANTERLKLTDIKLTKNKKMTLVWLGRAGERVQEVRVAEYDTENNNLWYYEGMKRSRVGIRIEKFDALFLVDGWGHKFDSKRTLVKNGMITWRLFDEKEAMNCFDDTVLQTKEKNLKTFWA